MGHCSKEARLRSPASPTTFLLVELIHVTPLFGRRSDDKLNVHLVSHSHHDPGWLKTYDQGFLGTRNDYHVRCAFPGLQQPRERSRPLHAPVHSVYTRLTRNEPSHCLQAHVGPHISAVQYELDGIMHGLMANPDRKFVYCEMVHIS